MGITSLVINTTGQIDVHPRIVKMISTDKIAAITAAGYLKQSPLAGAILSTDVVLCSFDSGTPGVPDWGLFTPLITNGVITLDPSSIEEFPTTLNYMATFSDLVGTLQNGSNPGINPGLIQSGINGGGIAGSFRLFPPTASSGSVLLYASNLSTNSQVSITTTATFGQSTSFIIGDNGSVSGAVLTASGQAVDGNGANYIYNNKSVTAAALASAAHVVIQPSSVSKSYIITDIWAGTGTNFSGGGGDRNLAITDGTNVYCVIPAASLQTIVNAKWGKASLPYPASVAIDLPTVAGASLYAQYSGGSADYSTGTLNLAVNVTRVA